MTQRQDENFFKLQIPVLNALNRPYVVMWDISHSPQLIGVDYSPAVPEIRKTATARKHRKSTA